MVNLETCEWIFDEKSFQEHGLDIAEVARTYEAQVQYDPSVAFVFPILLMEVISRESSEVYTYAKTVAELLTESVKEQGVDYAAVRMGVRHKYSQIVVVERNSQDAKINIFGKREAINGANARLQERDLQTIPQLPLPNDVTL